MTETIRKLPDIAKITLNAKFNSVHSRLSTNNRFTFNLSLILISSIKTKPCLLLLADWTLNELPAFAWRAAVLNRKHVLRCSQSWAAWRAAVPAPSPPVSWRKCYRRTSCVNTTSGRLRKPWRLPAPTSWSGVRSVTSPLSWTKRFLCSAVRILAAERLVGTGNFSCGCMDVMVTAGLHNIDTNSTAWVTSQLNSL